jgi:arsenate reductase
MVVFGTLRAGRSAAVAYAVGGYITAAYWFTSSTSFANPAVTVARMFTDTFAGITPAAAAAFIAMQLVGGVAGFALVRLLYPAAAETATAALLDRDRTPVSQVTSTP